MLLLIGKAGLVQVNSRAFVCACLWDSLSNFATAGRASLIELSLMLLKIPLEKVRSSQRVMDVYIGSLLQGHTSKGL